jgi:hypothetical protein
MDAMITSIFSQFAAGCAAESVFGIPTWYKYIDSQMVNGDCKLLGDFDINNFEQLLGIGIAIVEILLFFAGIIAVAYIIYGGFRYVLSQGEPENTKIAKDSILNAVIGLVIAILGSAIVRFIGSTLV